jgi:hypothetical protein
MRLACGLAGVGKKVKDKKGMCQLQVGVTGVVSIFQGL